MSSVASHYQTHLAPIYVWMCGGVEHALKLGAGDVAGFVGAGGYAVDLGAGFGMHTLALARSGYRVLAIDSSEQLLDELRQQARGLAVDVVHGDLLDFARHLQEKADLVLCMGDTLTHLQSMDQVATLMHGVKRALRPGGRFVATFRDYQRLPTDTHRFIPVRSDADRVLTCFLEDAGSHVRVHDVLHQRQGQGDTWTMTVSSYTKLRLQPEVARQTAAAAGLACHIEEGPRGMVRLQAVA